jgi:F-type H+-transporting ATPase subunit a
MVPVEFIGLFTKPFSLMVRLFVAITAGHIVILSLIGLVFIFQSHAVGVASTVMVIFINMIELLVATIQAYVFTLFSAMYIGAAVADHDHH